MTKKVLLLLIISVLCGGAFAQKRKTNKRAKPVKKEKQVNFVPPTISSDYYYDYNENAELYWKKILIGFEEAKKITVPEKLIIPGTTEVDELWSDIFAQDSIKWERYWKRFHTLSNANSEMWDWEREYAEYKEKAENLKNDKTDGIIKKYLPLISKVSDKKFENFDELKSYLYDYSPMVAMVSPPEERIYNPVASTDGFIEGYTRFAKMTMNINSYSRMSFIRGKKDEIKSIIQDYKKYSSEFDANQKEQLKTLGLELIAKLKEMPEANEVNETP